MWARSSRRPERTPTIVAPSARGARGRGASRARIRRPRRRRADRGRPAPRAAPPEHRRRRSRRRDARGRPRSTRPDVVAEVGQRVTSCRTRLNDHDLAVCPHAAARRQGSRSDRRRRSRSATPVGRSRPARCWPRSHPRRRGSRPLRPTVISGAGNACFVRTRNRWANPPGAESTPMIETSVGHSRSSPAAHQAHVPSPVNKVIVTRRPTQSASSGEPAATTRPTGSWPITNGNVGRYDAPSRMWRSVPQTPHASTSRRSSPARGSGSGTFGQVEVMRRDRGQQCGMHGSRARSGARRSTRRAARHRCDSDPSDRWMAVRGAGQPNRSQLVAIGRPARRVPIASRSSTPSPGGKWSSEVTQSESL